MFIRHRKYDKTSAAHCVQFFRNVSQHFDDEDQQMPLLSFRTRPIDYRFHPLSGRPLDPYVSADTSISAQVKAHSKLIQRRHSSPEIVFADLSDEDWVNRLKRPSLSIRGELLSSYVGSIFPTLVLTLWKRIGWLE